MLFMLVLLVYAGAISFQRRQSELLITYGAFNVNSCAF
jgi:hypothetical protein